MNSETHHPIPQPHEVSSREREDAMGSYLMMFASIGVGLPLPIINLIASVVYYFVNKNKSRFVHFHTLQSLLSQFPTSILNAVGVFWAFSLFRGNIEELAEETKQVSEIFPNAFMGYIIMVVIANLIYFIFSIIAASRAHKGRFYYMIFFGRLSYNHVYKRRPGDDEGKNDEAPINQPPR